MTEKKYPFFAFNIEQATTSNPYFRQVVATGPHMQLVLMSLKPNESIGEEVHSVDQFIRVEKGTGFAIVAGNRIELRDGDALLIPAGTKHNIIAKSELKLYTLYSSPTHGYDEREVSKPVDGD